MVLSLSLPVFHNDPFLEYRPFPAVPSNYFEAHWHEVVGAAVFYSILKSACAPLFTRWLGSAYTSMSRKDRAHFDIYSVSTVQNVLSILMLIPMWNHPHWANRAEDPALGIKGYYPFGGFASAMTVGYFAWDVYVCLRYYSVFGGVFLFHGVAAFYSFGTSFYPFLIPWVPAFLMFEASTPFVNFNWISRKLPAGTVSDRAIMANGIMLIITFFAARIVWGFYAAAILTFDIYRAWGEVPHFLPVTVLAVNYSLNVLNTFWFYKMLGMAKRRFWSHPARTPKENKRE